MSQTQTPQRQLSMKDVTRGLYQTELVVTSEKKDFSLQRFRQSAGNATG